MPTEREWRKLPNGALRAGSSAPDAEWVWVDVEGPDDTSLEMLRERFGIDDLVLEDALEQQLPPRFEDYGRYVAAAIRELTVTAGVVESAPLLCLVGAEFLVTIHHDALPGLEFIVETALAHDRTAEGGPDRMFARLAEVGSRRFEPVVEEIDVLLEDLEFQAMLAESGLIPTLQAVRRQIGRLRTVIRPQRSVMQSLVYADSLLIGDRARRRLTDVLERHAHLEETLESARNTANGVLEVHRGAVAEKANEIMKVLTLFSATLLPMTLIAGVYGMNFSNIPELDYRYGYPVALAVMATVGLVLWRYFATRGFVAQPKIASITAQTATRLADAAAMPVRALGSLILGGLRPPGEAEPETE